MIATAAGTPALALQYFRNTLADSAEFRTMVGASGASIQSQARARCYTFAYPPSADDVYRLDEETRLRPCALIYLPESGGVSYEHIATGVGREYRSSGSIICVLEQNVPQRLAGDDSECMWEWTVRFGTIIDEMLALSNTANGYLAIEQPIIVSGGPWRTHEKVRETKGDMQGVEITVGWQ